MSDVLELLQVSAARVRVIHGSNGGRDEALLSGIDRRGAPRYQTHAAGRIFPNNSLAPMPCIITDISATGARIELSSGWFNPYKEPDGIGQKFRLVMQVDRLEVPCLIVHIKENQMGVKFLKAPQPVARKA